MNKLMVFPLAILFFLTIYAIADTGKTYDSTTEDYETSEGLNMTGTDEQDVTVKIPKASAKTFNIWDSGYAIAIVVAAIAVGIIAGITVLGSGLKEISIRLIYQSILFLGLWGVLSAVSADYLFTNTLTTVFYVGVTLSYCIGFGQSLNATGD